MIKNFQTIAEMDAYINPLINGDFSGDDMLILTDHVKRLKAGDYYLEIGVKYGKSAACAIFSAMEGVHIFLCDVADWQAVPEPHFTISRKDFFESQKLDTKSVFMLGDSKKIASVWPNEIKFSLIFIDGDHLYEAVKADVKGWFPHLKKGGTMLFHDYGLGGVDMAVNELVRHSGQFRDFFIGMERYPVRSSSIAGAIKTNSPFFL